MTCDHMSFDSTVEIARLTDIDGLLTGFHASVKVWCHECKQEFVWLGVPSVGLSLDQVVVSPGGEELRCPIAPGYEWQGEGIQSPVRGFSVRRIG